MIFQAETGADPGSIHCHWFYQTWHPDTTVHVTELSSSHQTMEDIHLTCQTLVAKILRSQANSTSYPKQEEKQQHTRCWLRGEDCGYLGWWYVCQQHRTPKHFHSPSLPSTSSTLFHLPPPQDAWLYQAQLYTSKPSQSNPLLHQAHWFQSNNTLRKIEQFCL